MRRRRAPILARHARAPRESLRRPQLASLDMVRTRHVTHFVGRLTRPGRVFAYWFVDGRFAVLTAGVEWGCATGGGHVECVVSRHGDIDVRRWEDRPPMERRAAIQWHAVDGADAYRVDMRAVNGEWRTIAQVPSDGRWVYSCESPELMDLTTYEWRVVALYHENVLSVQTLPPRSIVRVPDAPKYTAQYSAATRRVTVTVEA